MIKKLLAFIAGFFKEGTNSSSKRLISISVSCSLIWAIVHSVLKAESDASRLSIIGYTMLFVLVMAGVTTISQIVSLVRGTSQPEPPKEEITQ